MTADILASTLLAHFHDLPDPRKPRGVRHPLESLVVISILAAMCGANTCSGIYQYALSNEEWLRTFLRLPHGIPSQDTFERLFQILAPDAWQPHFRAWTRELVLPDLPEGEDEVIAIDGKTARASRGEKNALHTVTAWSTQHGLALAQESVPEKKNEITVLADLLNVIEPAGAVITTDAMGAQKEVAWTIREHHAHYVLALKANHPNLSDDVRWTFEHADELGWNGIEHDYVRTVDKGHGRLETRECWVICDLGALDGEEVARWKDLRCVARVRSHRDIKGMESVEDRFFLTSLPRDATRILRVVRQHWGIENGLHWVLDVAFDEDTSRARAKNAQANWTALRRLITSILKQDKRTKAGIEAKRLKAGWDRTYLLQLLNT